MPDERQDLIEKLERGWIPVAPPREEDPAVIEMYRKFAIEMGWKSDA